MGSFDPFDNYPCTTARKPRFQPKPCKPKNSPSKNYKPNLTLQDALQAQALTLRKLEAYSAPNSQGEPRP